MLRSSVTTYDGSQCWQGYIDWWLEQSAWMKNAWRWMNEMCQSVTMKVRLARQYENHIPENIQYHDKIQYVTKIDPMKMKRFRTLPYMSLSCLIIKEPSSKVWTQNGCKGKTSVEMAQYCKCFASNNFQLAITISPLEHWLNAALNCKLPTIIPTSHEVQLRRSRILQCSNWYTF